MNWPTGRVTVRVEAAEEAGMVALTRAYSPQEDWMAMVVLRDLAAGGVPAVLVRVDGGVEVWRMREGMREGV